MSTSASSIEPNASGRTSRASRRSTYSTASDLDYRPSYLAAGIAALAVFALYLLTLAPSTAMWDTSEYIAAAYVLGLPHPPGNPFFVLIGRVFSVLPIAPSVAMRINILAAVCSAVSAGMWFLITERVLVSWFPRRWQRITGGALAALIGATAFTVWSQSVVNEKVYTVSLVGIAIVAWLTVRWCDEPDGSKADRLLILVAYLSGLGYTNHMGGFLALPAVAIAVLARRPGTIMRWKLLLACAAALVFGMTPFATQPIRAAYFPAINEGEPTGCANKIEVDCTFSELTKDRFMYNFNRGQYGKPELSDRQAPLSAQVGMYWLYFKWQWMRDADGDQPAPQAFLAFLFLGLGVLGGYVHWRRDRSSFLFFGPLVFTMTLALIYYMNFKYGYSQAPNLESTVEREVRDRDYFYLWSFSAWGVWAALGLVYIWETIAALFGADTVRLGNETVEQPRTRSWALASPILVLALIPLLANWKAASRAGQTDTRDFAHDLLNSVEPYGILVTVGDNDTFPLWYAQEVEGIRKDVLIANTSLLNTDWYTRQMLRRPVYEYDEAKGPAVYRGKKWSKPTGPPFDLTMQEADAVPLAVELRQAQLFKKDKIEAVIQPRLLTRADFFVLRMIMDAYPERSIYFSRTSGGYGQELGLGPYLLTQGLARRLLPETPSVDADTLLLAGEGFIDVPRTRALWDSVYLAPEAFVRNGDWVDRASAGIPYLYVTTGIVLAESLARQGDMATAGKVLARAESVAKATRLTEFTSLRQALPGGLLGDEPAPSAVPLESAPKSGARVP